MKKALKAILITLLSLLILIAIAVSVFTATNPDLAKGAFDLLLSAPGNNLKAAWIFVTSDSNSIGQQIDNNTQKYEDAVSNIMQGVTDTGEALSKEALEALNSGNYTEEEMTRIIASGGAELEAINKEKQEKEQESAQAENSPEKEEVIESENGDASNPVENQPAKDSHTETVTDTALEKAPDTLPENNPRPDVVVPSVTEAPSQNTEKVPEDTTPPEQNEQTNVPETKPVKTVDTASYIAKLYVVKSRFLSELTSIEKSIRNQYVSLPEEKQIPSERQRIAGQYIRTVAAMEVECDKEVDAILDELKAELTAAGMDTTMADNLLKAYNEEKSLKKAYYLDVYINGLP